MRNETEIQDRINTIKANLPFWENEAERRDVIAPGYHEYACDVVSTLRHELSVLLWVLGDSDESSHQETEQHDFGGLMEPDVDTPFDGYP